MWPQVPETWIIDPSGIVVDRIPTTITAEFLSTELAQLAPGLRMTRSLKGWPSWVLLVFVVGGLLAVGASRDAGARSPKERVEDISRRLACPICDGESVFESRNADSQAIRIEIARQVDTGTVSDDQIINYIEQRFGSKVLLVPRATGIDALVWALPVAALVCAVVGLGVAFRRWKTEADTIPDDADRRLVAAALAGDDGDDEL